MKLQIKVEKQTKLIDEAIEEMGKISFFTKAKSKVFAAVYKSKLNGLYYLIRKKLGSFIVKEGQDYFLTEEEGSIKYIDKVKNDLEKFLFGNEKDLNNEKEYSKFKNDRIIIEILRKFRKGLTTSKNFAIKKALGEGRVIDFFMRIGISITWEEKE